VSDLASVLDAEYTIQRYTGQSILYSQFSVHHQSLSRIQTGLITATYVPANPPSERFTLLRPTTWTRSSEIATVQSLLYAGLVISELAIVLPVDNQPYYRWGCCRRNPLRGRLT